jgi:hypothetical protein
VSRLDGIRHRLGQAEREAHRRGIRPPADTEDIDLRSASDLELAELIAGPDEDRAAAIVGCIRRRTARGAPPPAAKPRPRRYVADPSASAAAPESAPPLIAEPATEVAPPAPEPKPRKPKAEYAPPPLAWFSQASRESEAAMRSIEDRVF